MGPKEKMEKTKNILINVDKFLLYFSNLFLKNDQKGTLQHTLTNYIISNLINNYLFN